MTKEEGLFFIESTLLGQKSSFFPIFQLTIRPFIRIIATDYVSDNLIPYQEWRRERPDEATATCPAARCQVRRKRKMRMDLTFQLRRATVEFFHPYPTIRKEQTNGKKTFYL